MVTKVNRAGVFCEAGPLTIFVAQTVQSRYALPFTKLA
jgi:hypothetical protein